MIAFLTLNHAGLVFLQQLAIWHLRLVDPFGVLQCAGKDTREDFVPRGAGAPFIWTVRVMLRLVESGVHDVPGCV